MQVGVDAAGTAHADDGLHVVEVIKLVGVDANAGDAHAVAHHADALAIVGAGETQHATHIVKLNRVLEEVLGHELGAQGVASHDDGLGYFAILCPDVGGGGLCHKRRKLLVN